MKLLRISLIIGLILSLILIAMPIPAAAQGNGQNFGSERILVKFKEGTDEVTRQDILRRHGDFAEGDIARIGVSVVNIPAGKVQERLLAYLSEKAVQFAEPDFIATAIGTPNDPSFDNQWGMTKIQAPQAWDITTGQSSTMIAILDTGVDQNHEDLTAKIVTNKNFTSSSTVDDLYGHGTHVAGIAAAATNNGIGVAGVGYNSTIMNVKVLDDKGSGYYSWIANGIIWAADNGAKVISMSLGGSSPSSTLESAINYAWSKGVVIVAAAGNNGTSARVYPAYYTNVIAVAATDQSDAKASWSSYGSWVDVAAPGVNIFSTLPNHSNQIGQLNYGYLSGTSMATPFVAGLAGLVWASPYGTSNSSVRNRIESTADHISGTGTYWTYGRINAAKAVGISTAPPIIGHSPASLTFTATQGGANPANQTLNIQNTGGGTLSWSLSDNAAWLSLNPTTGSSTGQQNPVTASVNISGMTAGTYNAIITITASGATNTPQTVPVTLTINPATTSKMHVSSITMALKKVGNYTYALATITIVDAAGKPVAGAKVSGHWSVATNDSDTGTTNRSGQVTVQSNSVRRPSSGTTFTFTVDNVSLSGWTYDSVANVITSNSIKVK